MVFFLFVFFKFSTCSITITWEEKDCFSCASIARNIRKRLCSHHLNDQITTERSCAAGKESIKPEWVKHRFSLGLKMYTSVSSLPVQCLILSLGIAIVHPNLLSVIWLSGNPFCLCGCKTSRRILPYAQWGFSTVFLVSSSFGTY